MWFRRIILLITAAVLSNIAAAQKIALKNNVLMDGMASVNLGAEFATGARTTLEIPASFNLWSFTDSKKFKHVAVQPEFRLWTCQPFSGHFFGAHAHYASYNVGGLGPFDALKSHRYQGWLAGAGVSYGYDWILSPRWSLEASVGVGYAYLSLDEFPCGRCRLATAHKRIHYFGPTKISLSVIFIIK